MILPDYPIENINEDRLRRGPLAKKVGELIAGFAGKESFVIGIEGPWGSGKTSFINMAINGISNDPKLIFIHFNPWNFTGQNELIGDFFDALLDELKSHVDKNIFKTIKTYAGKLQVSYSPSIPTPIGSIGFGEFKKNQGSLQKQRDKINKALKILNKKIVVIIDDTDRLDNDETRLIMKLVKMTANFPNTVFVLAYDREQVAKKLGEDHIGEEYLKKIIQVSFTLPLPDQQGLKDVLYGDLDNTIKDIYGKVLLEGNDEKRWGEIQYAGFPRLFKNIRDIKRFISSLRLNWSIVEKSDINQIDFVTIEAIRVFTPTLYSGISGNANLFTGIQHFLTSNDNAKKELRLKFKELLEDLPKDLQPIMENICEVLFPQLENSNYSGDWEQIWKKERRICVSERIGFYFQLGIPVGAISEVEVSSLIEITDKEALEAKILELSKDNKLRQMLLKIQIKVDTLTETQRKLIVSSLWDLEKIITEERSVMFDFDDIDTQISRITYQSIKHLIPENRFTFLKELIESSASLYTPVRIVLMFTDIKDKSTGDKLLSDEETVVLKEILMKRLNNLMKENRLVEEEHLVFFLFRMKDWGNPDLVNDYIEKIIKTPKGLLAFINGFVGKVLSTAGDYYKLSKNEIPSLYELSEIETLVNDITDEEISKMNEKEQKAIMLFKNPPSRDL